MCVREREREWEWGSACNMSCHMQEKKTERNPVACSFHCYSCYTAIQMNRNEKILNKDNNSNNNNNNNIKSKNKANTFIVVVAYFYSKIKKWMFFVSSFGMSNACKSVKACNHIKRLPVPKHIRPTVRPYISTSSIYFFIHLYNRRTKQPTKSTAALVLGVFHVLAC